MGQVWQKVPRDQIMTKGDIKIQGYQKVTKGARLAEVT